MLKPLLCDQLLATLLWCNTSRQAAATTIASWHDAVVSGTACLITEFSNKSWNAAFWTPFLVIDSRNKASVDRKRPQLQASGL
jgi:hypothetical protein